MGEVAANACSFTANGEAMFFPFEHGQAASVQLQKNNNNTNSPYLSLSMLSTATGTGAAATGIIATVPGVLRTRKQSKCMSIYLLKIHQEGKSRQIQESIWTSWKVYVVT
jgi:hypothetical protein